MEVVGINVPDEYLDAVGYIHSYESCALVDGPGVRYALFLQGCKMRCKYCHNPETWSFSGGEEKTARNVWQRLRSYKNYWRDNGGITVSGGEPLLQIDFLIGLFAQAKKEGVHTCVDTAGEPFNTEDLDLKKLDLLMSLTDLVLLDIKEIDSQKHKELCGYPNENILDFGRYLSKNGKKLWVRRVLVPGLTDNEEGLKKTDEYIKSLGEAVRRVEVLPYHTFGLIKWQNLGIKYPLEGYHIPKPEEVKKAEEILDIMSYPDHA